MRSVQPVVHKLDSGGYLVDQSSESAELSQRVDKLADLLERHGITEKPAIKAA